MRRLGPWWEQLVGAAMLVALLGIWLHGFLALPPSDFDDAYMALRYADHFLGGQGVTWNPGEPWIYGMTSRLHFAWVVLVRAAFPHHAPAAILRVASGSMAVALLAAMPLALALFGRPRRYGLALWVVVVIPAFGFTEAFRFHAASGMDTLLGALTTLFVVVATVRLCQGPSSNRVWISVAVGYLAVLARPENAVPALLCPLLALWFFAPVARGRLIGQLVLSTLALWALDLGLCAHFLGSPLPLAFYAKRPGYYASFAGEHGWNPYWFVRVFLLSTWPAWVAALGFARLSLLKRGLVFAVPLFLGIGALFTFNQIMGHLGRFYFPLLPLVLILGAQGIDGLPSLSQVSRRTGARLVAQVGAAAVLVYGLQALALELGQGRVDAAPALPPLPDVLGNEVPGEFPPQDSWAAARDMARLMILAPPGTTFAMSEHGLPGALAPNVPIVDVLGLHDGEVARHGFSAQDLFRRRPDVLWMPHPDHVGMWREIAAAPEFQQGYAFFRDAFHFGVAVRKDSPVFPLWPGLVRRLGFPPPRERDLAAP